MVVETNVVETNRGKGDDILVFVILRDTFRECCRNTWVIRLFASREWLVTPEQRSFSTSENATVALHTLVRLCRACPRVQRTAVLWMFSPSRFGIKGIVFREFHVVGQAFAPRGAVICPLSRCYCRVAWIQIALLRDRDDFSVVFNSCYDTFIVIYRAFARDWFNKGICAPISITTWCFG